MENSIKPLRKKIDPVAFAQALKDGATTQDALLAAGKSPAQARKGRKAVTGPLKAAYRELLGKDYDEMVEIGKHVNPETMRHAVLGGLAKGIAERNDKGAQVLKLAGSWKELSMWREESLTGTVVISAVNLPAFDDVPTSQNETGHK